MSTDEKKVYTIDDIAKELGVSKTTVSRAISGKGRISEKTTKRVQAFIEEHHYRPNVIAKGLAKQKTYNVGLVFPYDYTASEFSFFKDCMNGICESASRYNYDVVVSMTRGDDISQVVRLIVNRKVDGVILSRSVVSSRIQDYLQEHRVPFVVIGPPAKSGIVYVDNKNQEAADEMTSYLLMKGTQRIALLGGSRSYCVTDSRLNGYLEAHTRLGKSVNEELILLDIETQEDTARAVDKALRLQADAILCMDEVISSMAITCLRARNVTFPGQIRLASLYDSEYLRGIESPVTAVQFDSVKLGCNACLELLRLLGKNMEEALYPLNYQVVLRESTK